MEELLLLTKCVLARFLWYSIINDGADFVKNCETCQKQRSLTLEAKTWLHVIHVPTDVMIQIYVDICNLPEVYGYCSLVACIDYFN